MRFTLLGTLTLLGGGGEPLTVSGARRRILLAALLLSANEPVSHDLLAEAVWDGRPPPGAAATLRSHIRRLRHVLGPEAAARIKAREPGYQISLGEPELDVLRFEALCRQAGAARRVAEWIEASAAAAQALQLWRGAPLLDVPSQVLQDRFVPRLEQQRQQVLEDGIEAGLHLGRHDELVPQLRALATRFPLRERFHAQLMLALARIGRQAEALEVYQDARRVLVDELGVEPGPELRQLQQRILTGGAETAMPSAGCRPCVPARTGASTPRQLPAGARHFTGRRAELDQLTGLSGESVPAGGGAGGGTVVISALDGMAGIGKTALAVHAAHRLTERFPDGQLYIDLHGYTRAVSPRTPDEALKWMLRGLGVPTRQIPRDLEARAALYRHRLTDSRTLILLDNALDERQVRPLLPGSSGSLVLVTSRRRLKGLDDAHALSLDVLSQADAVAWLRSVAGPERVRPDDPVLGEIVELCGHLPLALRIAAALLRHRPSWSLDHLAGLLRDRRRRIRVLSDGERDLSAVFDLSYQALTDSQQRLFRLLGAIPGSDIDSRAASALIGAGLDTTTRLLEDLVDHNLLIECSPWRYRLHDLLRDYARVMAESTAAEDLEAALARLVDYHRHASDDAGRGRRASSTASPTRTRRPCIC